MIIRVQKENAKRKNVEVIFYTLLYLIRKKAPAFA